MISIITKALPSDRSQIYLFARSVECFLRIFRKGKFLIYRKPIYNFKMKLVLIANRPKAGTRDKDFESILESAAGVIKDYIGEMHGPLALKVYGNEIAKHRLEIDASSRGYSAIVLDCRGPDSMENRLFLEKIETFWKGLGISSGDIYIL